MAVDGLLRPRNIEGFPLRRPAIEVCTLRLSLAALADPPALASLITQDFGASPVIVFALGSFSINFHVILTVCCWHRGVIYVLTGDLNFEIAVARRELCVLVVVLVLLLLSTGLRSPSARTVTARGRLRCCRHSCRWRRCGGSLCFSGVDRFRPFNLPFVSSDQGRRLWVLCSDCCLDAIPASFAVRSLCHIKQLGLAAQAIRGVAVLLKMCGSDLEVA